MSLTMAEITSLPNHGTLTWDEYQVAAPYWISVATLSGLAYTPNTGYTGAESFGWTGYDGTYLASNSASVNIVVQATGQNPTVSSFSKMETKTRRLALSPVTSPGIFSDPNVGLSLSMTEITSLPNHGTLTWYGYQVTASEMISVGTLGGLAYTPNTGYTGADSFGWTDSTAPIGRATVPVSISRLGRIQL